MDPPQLQISRLNEPLISVEDAAVLQEEDEAELWTPLSLGKEAGRLMQLAVPLSIQYVFAYITLLISTAFCGHLGSFELSVAVLSTSIYNVMGNSILIGFSSAIETLCGMAYGAKNYSKMGILLQRAVIITSSVFVVICLIWLGMEPLLRLAGQEPQLAHAAAKYLHLSMPALFANGCINCVLQRYLQAQGIVFPITVAIGIIAILSPFYMYFFIYVLDLGLSGAPLGTGANNFSIALALIIVTCYREYSLWGTEKQMWSGWSRRAFKGLGTYLSLAVPSTGMICLEWWAFEVVVLMAGNLQPNPELAVAVMGVCMNLNAALYMVPRGMSGAASTRVSNELGAGRAKHAKQAAWMAVLLGGASSALLGLGCYLLRERLVRIFTMDPEVLSADLSIFAVMCGTIFTDGVNVSIEGVIRGSGKQALAASINVVTYWGIGIVSAWYFAFPLGMRVGGFWLSRLMATSVQMIVMLVVLLFLYDWKALSEMAVAHIAAATPRAGTSVDQSKSAFSRPTVEDGLPEAQLPPTPPPRSPRPQGGTTAVSIRQRQRDLQRTESDALSATPQYSYTSHVTMGGSFAAR